MNMQTIVADLLKTGLTQVQLAALANCSQSTVSSLYRGARGKRVSKCLADQLMIVHERYCKQLTPMSCGLSNHELGGKSALNEAQGAA